MTVIIVDDHSSLADELIRRLDSEFTITTADEVDRNPVTFEFKCYDIDDDLKLWNLKKPVNPKPYFRQRERW